MTTIELRPVGTVRHDRTGTRVVLWWADQVPQRRPARPAHRPGLGSDLAPHHRGVRGLRLGDGLPALTRHAEGPDTLSGARALRT